MVTHPCHVGWTQILRFSQDDKHLAEANASLSCHADLREAKRLD